MKSPLNHHEPPNLGVPTHSKGGGGLPRQRLDKVQVALRSMEVFSELSECRGENPQGFPLVFESSYMEISTFF